MPICAARTANGKTSSAAKPTRNGSGWNLLEDETGRGLLIPSGAAEAASPLDALAEDGPELVSAAYLLASEIFPQFGVAETPNLPGPRITLWTRPA
jgi:hypothetical protein